MNEFKRPVWSSDVRKVLAGLAIGLAGAGMIYAAAATAAGIIAESFTSSETEMHARAVAFSVAVANEREKRARGLVPR